MGWQVNVVLPLKSASLNTVRAQTQFHGNLARFDAEKSPALDAAQALRCAKREGLDCRNSILKCGTTYRAESLSQLTQK